jgi:UDPglucose 6-dehydrogenase
MNVGFVGLGKLGLPVATAIAARGINVHGYDPHVTGYPKDLSHEAGFDQLVKDADGRVRFGALDDVVRYTDGVVFVAVQTPHEPRFEGVTPLPEDRADFDYSFLKVAVARIAAAAWYLNRETTIVVISTVLPGTMRQHIVPMLGSKSKLVYNPSFIAMGTTIQDFARPEFVLLGGDDEGKVEKVYRRIFNGWDDVRFVRTTVENAELIKVAYNTFIGLKIAFANTLMEVCHKTGCDVDEVTGALKHANRRLISGAYLDGGMGDGGGCHPRDNIALSWLARELDLSYDLFGAAMEAREAQARWLADLMCEHELPKAIVGYAYKPESRLIAGSPALLVAEILRQRNIQVDLRDPYVIRDAEALGLTPKRSVPIRIVDAPHVVLIGCKHPEFATWIFPEGSVVLDPFRYIPDQEGVEVVRIGQCPVPNDRQARISRALSATAP